MQLQTECVQRGHVVSERATALLEILDGRDADVGALRQLASGPFRVTSPVVDVAACIHPTPDECKRLQLCTLIYPQ